MKKINWKRCLILITGFVPVLSNAEETFASISGKLYTSIFSQIINILLLATFVFFAWSVVKFLFSKGDKKDEAKNTLFWGVIALFVMVSFWGILRMVNDTFTKDELGENEKYNFKLDYQKYQPSPGNMGN